MDGGNILNLKTTNAQINFGSEEAESRRKCQEEKLLQNAEQDGKVFVKTRGYVRARTTLDNRDIVIIVGSSGEGKTCIARQLVRNEIYNNFQYRPINKSSDWELVSTKDNYVILIENAFQKKHCCHKQTPDWKKWICTIEEHLLNVEKTDGNIKMVITMKPDIFSSMRDLYPYSWLFNTENDISVNLGSISLSFEEKTQIFRQHDLEFGSVKFDESCVNRICQYDPPSFPRCVNVFFTTKEIQQMGTSFFENPTQIFDSEISNVFEKDKPLYALLVLLLLHDCELHVSMLEKVIQSTELDMFASLLGCSKHDVDVQHMNKKLHETLAREQPLYIQKKDGFIRFRHRCISHAVCLSFGDKMPEHSLQYLPFSFIMNMVSLEKSRFPENREMVVLPPWKYSNLADRFISELELGNIQQVCQHRAFRSQCFVTCFISRLSDIMSTNAFRLKFILQITERSKCYGALWNGSLLYWSASVGSEYLCLSLLEKRFYSSIEDKFFVRTQSSAALIVSCWYGFRKSVLQYLIELGANVNSSLHEERRHQTYNCDYCTLQDSNGMTVLQSAIYGDHSINYETVEFILRSGVKFRDHAYKYRPLIQAVKKGDVPLIKLLLRYNVDINAVDTNLHTAMYYVVKQNNLEIAQILLKYSGAEFKTSENLLTEASSTEMASLLMSVNANTNIHANDGYGRSLLHLAKNAELARYWISLSCKVNQKDKFGRTPLFYANEVEVAQTLIEKGADVNVTDYKQRNIFHYIKKANVFETVVHKMSHRRKVENLNIEDESGKTPIFFASTTEMLNVLLKHGSVVNHKANQYKQRGDSMCEPSEEYKKLGDLIYTEVCSVDGDQKNKIREKYLHNWLTISNGGAHISEISDNHTKSPLPTTFSGQDYVFETSSCESLGERTSFEGSSKPDEKDDNLDCDLSFDHCKSNYNILMWLILERKLDSDLLGVTFEHSIDILCTDNNGQTVLHYLVSPPQRINNLKHIIEQVFTYVKKREESLPTFLNAKDHNGNTALHLACKCRAYNKLRGPERRKIIEMLLDRGADPQIKNNCHETPLHTILTCRCRFDTIPRGMLDRNVNINAKCIRGWQALHFVMSVQDFSEPFIAKSQQLIHELREAGADVENFMDAKNFFPENCNPLLLDYFLDQFDVTKTMTTAMLSKCRESGEHILAWACVAVINAIRKCTTYKNFLEICCIEPETTHKSEIFKHCMQGLQNERLLEIVVKFLYESDSQDINSADNEGNTVLMTAVKGNQNGNLNLIGCVTYLLEQGADPNARNRKDLSVVNQCISSNGTMSYVMECLAVLVKFKADMTDEKNYLLAVNAKCLRSSVLKYIPTNVYSNVSDELGNSFHHLMKMYGTLMNSIPSIVTISELQKRGVDINGQNSNGETPLHLAMKMNVPKSVVAELLLRGASVDIPNRNGLTPYHYIFIHRDVEELDIFYEFLKSHQNYCISDIRALHFIVAKMKRDTLKILLKFLEVTTCDINSTEWNGESILHSACVANMDDEIWCTSLRCRIVPLLLTKGADVNSTDSFGRTVMHKLVRDYNDIYNSDPERSGVKQLHCLIAMMSSVLSYNINRQAADRENKTVGEFLEQYKLYDLSDFINGKITPEVVNDKTVDSIITNRQLTQLQF